MPQFHFRLATLQRLRESDRDERRGQLAEAQRAEQIVIERIAAIDNEIEQLRTQCVEATRPGKVDVDLLMESQRFELILKLERQTAEQQRQLVAAEVQKRRDALVAVDREVRVLEKLRDTQLERHRQDEEKRDMQQLDEIAGRGFWRKEE